MTAEFSFNYLGPKVPQKVRGCVVCASAHSGLCMHQPPHGSLVEGCGLCDAAKAGVCGAHGRGVAKALAECPELPTHVRALIEAELSLVSDERSVQVKAFGNEGQDHDAAGQRTGIPARVLEVAVKQIEG